MKLIKNNNIDYILISILLITSFLRLYHLDFQSAWADEVLNLKESETSLSFKEVYDIVLFRDSTSFLYIFSVHYLSILIGHTIFTARLISAVSGILSVFYIYKLGNLIYNKRVGYFAAILLSVNLFHIEYSQEGRSYSLLTLFVIIAFYRLIIFINKTNLLNAIYLGFFTGLVTNAHPIGILNVASIYLLIFFVLILIKTKKEKLKLLKYSIISFAITLIVFYFIYPIVLAASQIKSFWIPEPTYEGIKQVFIDVIGRSELLLLFVMIAIVYTGVKTIISFKTNKKLILQNKLFLAYLILFLWIFVEVSIVIIKSYIGVSIVLSRYLIAILPASLLMLALAIELINIKLIKYVIITFLVCFSIYSIFYTKNYYNTITKAQFDKIENFIVKSNRNNDKIVSRYGWVLSYYINKNNPNTLVVEKSLDDFITGMKNKAIPTESFWYLDGNSAPYVVNPENTKYLEEYFLLKEDKEMFDCWAKHYELKVNKKEKIKFENGEIKLFFKDFKSANIDGNGNLLILENSILTSTEVELLKGFYTLVINGNSYPNPPIKGQNAHLKIKVNNNQIADYYVSEKSALTAKEIKFKNNSEKINISIEYDNDLFIDKLDRNVVIYEIKIKTH